MVSRDPIRTIVKGFLNYDIVISTLQRDDEFVMYPQQEILRWECIHCHSVMDRTNFIDFIKQSDNDKNSNQEAKCSITPGD
jgi:hypothetical protein